MAHLIPSLRAASRKLVREWGFLRPTLAGTAFSHAAVHCLVEIGDHSPRDFSELCTELRVSAADLKPAIAELLSSNQIQLTEPSSTQTSEARPQEEHYSLTPTGLETLEEINAYAQNQVTKALQIPHPTFGTDITTALSLYAAALEATRLNEANPTPALTPLASPTRAPATPPGLSSSPGPTVKIVPGYRPGILGRTLEMHATYYWNLAGWGKEFESDLGLGISDLIKRLDNPVNQVWSAVRTMPGGGKRQAEEEHIVGVIYVDGECEGGEAENVARIRAFILDEDARGLGLGKRLVGEAMQFVRERGFRECRLNTSRELVPAIRLYEKAGFVETGEKWDGHWGGGHMVVFYTWYRDGDRGGGVTQS